MDCSVCLESFDDEINSKRPYLINPCGHCFCSDCLTRWNKRICPQCRGKIESITCNRPLIESITERKPN